MANNKNITTGFFDWLEYLESKGMSMSDAAPPECFNQAPVPPVNSFQLGSHLAVTDPLTNDRICLASVVKINGPRICLRMKFMDDSRDFWRMCDSGDMWPLDVIEEKGVELKRPSAQQGLRVTLERFPILLKTALKECNRAAPEWFLEPPAKPEKNLFRPLQKLEIVDASETRNSEIWPGTIVKVKDDSITVSFDDWGHQYDVTLPYDSRDIFPCGFAERSQHQMCWKEWRSQLCSPIAAALQRMLKETHNGTPGSGGMGQTAANGPLSTAVSPVMKAKKSAAKGNLSTQAVAKFVGAQENDPEQLRLDLSSDNSAAAEPIPVQPIPVGLTAYISAHCKAGPMFDGRYFRWKQVWTVGPQPLSQLFIAIVERLLPFAKNPENLVKLIPQEGLAQEYTMGDIRMAGMLPDFNNDADVFWDRMKVFLRAMGSCENFVSGLKFATPCMMCQLGGTKGCRPASAPVDNITPAAKKQKMADPQTSKAQARKVTKNFSVEEVAQWLSVNQRESTHVEEVVEAFRAKFIAGDAFLGMKNQPAQFLLEHLGLSVGAALALVNWLKEMPKE